MRVDRPNSLALQRCFVVIKPKCTSDMNRGGGALFSTRTGH